MNTRCSPRVKGNLSQDDGFDDDNDDAFGRLSTRVRDGANAYDQAFSSFLKP